MKNAIIVHGTACTPNSYWLPSIKKFLEKEGYTVWAPQLPEATRPSLVTQLPFLLENGKFTNETVLIGHSAGCPLLLALLEKINVQVAKVILVAGFGRPLKGNTLALPVVKKFDWKRIRANARQFFFINSDNDPWNCNDKEGHYLFKNLGASN